MLYTLSAVIFACKFGGCYYVPYQEYTTNATACLTLRTRIVSIANASGFIDAQVVSCDIRTNGFNSRRYLG